MSSEFQGKPVYGEINHYSRGVAEQHDPEVLMGVLDRLLNVPMVEWVEWDQYTPYFNDGDACVFTVWSARVKLTIHDEPLDDLDLFQYGEGGTFQEQRKNGTYSFNGHDTGEVYEALTALLREMGHHEVNLQKTFGDPANVCYDGSEFHVEFVDHE